MKIEKIGEKMDKVKLSKLILTGNASIVSIPSLSTKAEKDKLIRDFSVKAGTLAEGEIVLVLLTT
jgi:hypothetical protein